jgi:hypothetical protein
MCPLHILADWVSLAQEERLGVFLLQSAWSSSVWMSIEFNRLPDVVRDLEAWCF